MPKHRDDWNGYSFVPCPGCQYSWNQLGIWQVSYGLATALPLPEIYLSSWANQWAAISYYGVIAHQYKVVFDGPMDEHPRDTSTLTATAAWRKLRVALRGFGGTINQTPPWRSEIQGTGT